MLHQLKDEYLKISYCDRGADTLWLINYFRINISVEPTEARDKYSGA